MKLWMFYVAAVYLVTVIGVEPRLILEHQESKRNTNECRDESRYCDLFLNQCHTSFVRPLCQNTCNVCVPECKDIAINCPLYVSLCHDKRVRPFCQKTCNVCGPDCDPACQNGGTCNEENKCDCRPEWKGDACDIEYRPIDWQPVYCENLLNNASPLPKMEENGNKIEFNSGPPITEEEIQAALIATVPNISNSLPCSSVFPQDFQDLSNRGVVNPNWPNAEIPYELNENLSNEQRSLIIKAMEEIKEKTCISFPARTANHANWMHIRAGGFESGCSASHMGIDPDWPDVVVNLESTGCFYHGTIVHEILHVAGLAHEHTRMDRDQFVTINWENIEEGNRYLYQFCKVKNTDTGHLYDYDSIMHYPKWGFQKAPGLDTIDAHGYAIGYPGKMSQGDVDQLNHIYCKENKLRDD